MKKSPSAAASFKQQFRASLTPNVQESESAGFLPGKESILTNGTLSLNDVVGFEQDHMHADGGYMLKSVAAPSEIHGQDSPLMSKAFLHGLKPQPQQPTVDPEVVA